MRMSVCMFERVGGITTLGIGTLVPAPHLLRLFERHPEGGEGGVQGVIVEGTHTAGPRLAGARRRAWRTSVSAARGSAHGLSEARAPPVAISSCSAPVGCVSEIRAAHGPAQLTRVHLLGRGRVGGMGGVSPGGVICSRKERDIRLFLLIEFIMKVKPASTPRKEGKAWKSK